MYRSLFKTIAYLTLVLITSCNPYRYIDIDVLEPAETDSLLQFKKLIISSENVFFDTLNRSNSNYYSLFLSNFKYELKKKLFETPLFNTSEIIDSDDYNIKKIIENLDSVQKKYITVCTIKTVKLSDSVQYILGYDSWYMKYKIKYHLKLQFCNLSTPKLYTNKFIDDISYWVSPEISNEIWNIAVSCENKPSKDMAYKYCGVDAADVAVYKITPYWLIAERVLFYNKNKQMESAYNAYCNNQLNNAIQDWKIAFYNKNRKITAQAAHNLAVCYEIKDSIGLAINWINLSTKYKKYEKSISYKKILTKRFYDTYKLNNQFLNKEE
jgi:hypothetical protein